MRVAATAFVTAAAVLSLAGCAGTPPPGAQASTADKGKCEHMTGSMLCANEADQDSLSSGNSPAVQGTQNGLSGGGQK